MDNPIEQRLAELGVVLPAAPAAVGAYVPWVRFGNLVVISGQLPFENGQIKYSGKVGAEITEADGYQAARLCAINGLAQLKSAVGSLDKIKQIIRVEGYVHSAAGYHGQPKVLNGASELIGAVFGDRGRHTRVALGISEMPLNAAVQVCLWAEVV